MFLNCVPKPAFRYTSVSGFWELICSPTVEWSQAGRLPKSVSLYVPLRKRTLYIQAAVSRSGRCPMDQTPRPVSLAAALVLPRTPGRSAEVFTDGDLEVRFAARP